jgi:multiple sugar transport system ATP-binding protein
LYEATVLRDEDAVALRGFTLLAHPGEFLVVVGPSGSGKSTVLRAIAGLAGIRSGQVRINGQDVTKLSPAARDVAMVFEYGALLPFLDVSHNLALSLQLRHVPRGEVDEQVQEQARRLRLTRLLSRRPASLSPGERGRVGIGRALMRTPQVFLLDEPLANLDAGSRAQLRRELADVIRGMGVTTFYVTHDQAEACAIADRVAVINNGSVLQVASPGHLYAQPADIFVAGFIGSGPLGLLRAELVSSGGLAGFRVGARTLPLWAAVPPPLQGRVGDELVIGLRPEDVRDAAENPSADLVTLPGVVRHREYTGACTLVSVAIDAEPVRAPGADPRPGEPNALLCVRFARHCDLPVGAPVEVAVDVSRAHVFDSRTGRALCHLGQLRDPH